MENLLILIAILVVLAVVLAPIGVIGLSRKVRLLTTRIEQLERNLNAGVHPVHPVEKQRDETRTRPTPWGPKQADAKAVTVVDAAVTVSQDDPLHEQAEAVPKAFVFRKDTIETAAHWIKENWFLGIAALSLALAGIFMVQYGVEQGLLTPFARILGALGLGAAFILGGEFVRRRFGDESGSMRALPSTFSGAGIVTLFAAVLSARHLYDMLPSDLALVALVAVAGLAIALGWFYGPFLAAIGIFGALAAPFAVGGSSDAPHLFYYYFALVIVMALAIDTVRRWAWVSVLALIGGFVATWMLLTSGAEAVHALGFALIATVAATAIPQRKIWPDHAGALLSELHRKRWPEFPTRLAGGTFVAALALSLVIPFMSVTSLEAWLGVWSVVALGLLALIWMRRAPALEDLSALAPLSLLGLIAMLSLDNALIFRDFVQHPGLEAAQGVAMPMAASVFAGGFALFAALGFWRASNGVRASLVWVGASAFALPAALGALDLFWSPSAVIGAYAWAGHAMAGAALMTVLCERSVRRWQKDKRPAALFAMSALSLITFALMLVLSTAALSVAIGVMIILATFIDRRLDMPWLGVFIQLAVAVLAWRFLIDPGVPWASWQYTPFWEVALAYAGPLALMGAAWFVLQPISRQGAQLALESAIWTLGAVFALILLERWLRSDIDSFWGISLAGSVLLTSLGAQLYRWRAGARFGYLRLGFAGLIAVIAFVVFFIALIVMSPLGAWGARDVEGPLLLDTIAVAYLIPAAILAAFAWKLVHLHRIARAICAGLSALLGMSYVGLEIRRFWQGDNIAGHLVSQGELYSYTIAMMIASVAILFLAFAKRSVGLRKLALAGIALTIAKVFLVDMSGLTGLVRVASFLGLGLALSALAWLNRAMSARWDRPEKLDRP